MQARASRVGCLEGCRRLLHAPSIGTQKKRGRGTTGQGGKPAAASGHADCQLSCSAQQDNWTGGAADATSQVLGRQPHKNVADADYLATALSPESSRQSAGAATAAAAPALRRCGGGQTQKRGGGHVLPADGYCTKSQIPMQCRLGDALPQAPTAAIWRRGATRPVVLRCAAAAHLDHTLAHCCSCAHYHLQLAAQTGISPGGRSWCAHRVRHRAAAASLAAADAEHAPNAPSLAAQQGAADPFARWHPPAAAAAAAAARPCGACRAHHPSLSPLTLSPHSPLTLSPLSPHSLTFLTAPHFAGEQLTLRGPSRRRRGRAGLPAAAQPWRRPCLTSSARTR